MYSARTPKRTPTRLPLTVSPRMLPPWVMGVVAPVRSMSTPVPAKFIAVTSASRKCEQRRMRMPTCPCSVRSRQSPVSPPSIVRSRIVQSRTPSWRNTMPFAAGRMTVPGPVPARVTPAGTVTSLKRYVPASIITMPGPSARAFRNAELSSDPSSAPSGRDPSSLVKSASERTPGTCAPAWQRVRMHRHTSKRSGMVWLPVRRRVVRTALAIHRADAGTLCAGEGRTTLRAPRTVTEMPGVDFRCAP